MRRYRKNCDTVVTLFEGTVRRYPDKVALVMVDGKSWTFRDLDLYSNMVANCFREQVVVVYHSIIIQSANCKRWTCPLTPLSLLTLFSVMVKFILRSDVFFQCDM